MANIKKKQDEENLKILREMVAVQHNKNCFDCDQRGPTYINMTIGSFICTSCSGLLRGLNPPHRVKSISMASFTPEEMEFIRSRGNTFCQKVWLGLHDMRALPSVDVRDEVKMKELMTQRYEKKRWYVAPTDAMYEEARKQNTSTPVATSKQSALMRPTIASVQVEAAPVASQLIQRPTVSSTVSGTDQLLMRIPSISDGQSRLQNDSNVPAKVDLLADFGGDPFAAFPMPSQSTDSSDGFANFAVFSNNSNTVAASLGQPSRSVVQPQSTPFYANYSSLTTPSSAPPVPADKYSALAELENAFMAPASAPSTVNWDSMNSGIGPSSSWATAGFSSNTTGSSAYSAHPFQAGGALSAASYNASNGQCQGQVGGISVAVNPFGLPHMALAAHPQATTNPFAMGPSYPQPAVMGYGAAPQVSGAAHFGIPSMSSSNQMGLNGGPWNIPQPAQVPSQQVNAGWGQAAAINPFMSSFQLMIPSERPDDVERAFSKIESV